MPNKLFDESRVWILDGAMGTMLQQAGLAPGEIPDVWSVTHPEMVTGIHKAYLEAGSNFISTNTFGANGKKLAGCGYTVAQVVTAAVQCAKKAAEGTNAKILLDIGPLGEMLQPMGTLPFEQACDLFKEVVTAGAAAGADAVYFETMTDLLEVKAGILAAKETCDLPVMASMTFEATGRTFTGCQVESFAVTAQVLGADAVGINCSLGPAEIMPLVERLCAACRLPVFAKPNAGLPDPATGLYDLHPADFRAQMDQYKRLGVAAVGGCCGTSPAYLKELTECFAGCAPKRAAYQPESWVCSAMQAVKVRPGTVIGERINPTGKKKMKEALRAGDMDYLLGQAVEQAQAGAQILDVNVGLPEIDEAEMMRRAVTAIQGVTELPLQLDSTRPEVLETGLRVYNGKPIVNSVNAEPAVLAAVLPLCKKYGAAVVGLTLNDSGIPAKAEDRVEMARRILDAALEAGIPKEDVYIDCLTLTASAQQQDVWDTLRAVRTVKEELGLKTVLGVSNVSFGLPVRAQLNTAFLGMALAHGLDLPIMNPNEPSMMAAVRSFRVFTAQDEGAAEYIAAYGGQTAAPVQTAAQPGAPVDLKDAVVLGLKAQAGEAARLALETTDPQELVNGVLIPALDQVGDAFEKGTCFLPQLLQSAAAAQAAFDEVKTAIEKQGVSGEKKGPIVVATVKGDIHDIGKNIVKVILENYGYRVIDLGRDVPPEAVVEAASRHGAKLVGLSALMTTTLPAMQQTIEALRTAGVDCKIMVGGAVLTPDYAKMIGADYYVKDAKCSADVARQIFG